MKKEQNNELIGKKGALRRKNTRQGRLPAERKIK